MVRETKRIHPYRPPVEPRPAATVVLMRDMPGGFELLMTRRSQQASFAPGAFVFPGGALDKADAAEPAHRISRFRESQDAELRAYSIAALRESYEELGILLAYRADGSLVVQSDVEALDRRHPDFFAQVEQAGLTLAADQLHWYCHWITDRDLPKRFDVRFLLARVPAQQQAIADEAEQFEPTWISPRDALDGHAAGRIPMIFPTIRTLTRLAECGSVDEVFAQCEHEKPIFVSCPRGANYQGGVVRFSEHEAPYGELELICPDGRLAHNLDWQAQRPVPLMRHVERLTAPNPGMMTGPGTNTYIIGDDDSGYAVIDPGPDEPIHIERIAARVGDKLKYIICTHSHPDHSPGAAPLKALAGGTIMGRATGELVADLWPFEPEHTLEHGDKLSLGDSTIRAIHTPGHASNHVCLLLEEDGLLFSGDHMNNGTTVVINPPDGDMHAYMKSLELLKLERIAYILPAHGWVLGFPLQAIDALIAHRMGRERKVLASLESIGGTAAFDALLPVVYNDVPAKLHPVASRSLRAHLDKLLIDGRVQQNDQVWALR